MSKIVESSTLIVHIFVFNTGTYYSDKATKTVYRYTYISL